MSEAKVILELFTTAIRHRDDLKEWLRSAEIEFEIITTNAEVESVGIVIDGELWIVHFNHATGTFKQMVWA